MSATNYIYIYILGLLTSTSNMIQQVVETSAKFDMLLKVKRGDKEEKFKVEVHRNNEGAFHLNKMDAHH